jgi:hypothetical protein
MGHGFRRPGAMDLKSPAMLEALDANRPASDKPAFWCRDGTPQRLAERNPTMSEQTGLRRRP